CLLFSSLLSLNLLYQPNSLDVLCWTAFYYVSIRYVKEENVKWLYMAALIFALGFLNKYNMVFMITPLLLALCLMPQRRLLCNKHVFRSALLALLLIAPNLYWQYLNDFPVIHHMRELAETQLVHVQRAALLRSQFFYFLGGIPLLIAALLGFWIDRNFKPYRFMLWSFL